MSNQRKTNNKIDILFALHCRTVKRICYSGRWGEIIDVKVSRGKTGFPLRLPRWQKRKCEEVFSGTDIVPTREYQVESFFFVWGGAVYAWVSDLRQDTPTGGTLSFSWTYQHRLETLPYLPRAGMYACERACVFPPDVHKCAQSLNVRARTRKRDPRLIAWVWLNWVKTREKKQHGSIWGRSG